MPRSANELYRRLRSQNHGIPQFTPEPNENLPLEYRRVGVSIGDVGIWSEDSFDVLFNACWPATHSINAIQGVPEDFVPFPLEARDISRRLYHSPGSVIANAKVHKIALDVGASSISNPVTFELESKEFAMLVLPEGASRERLLAVETFREHVKRCSRQWYKFAGDRLPSKNSLFVVTGCDKTASWGIATASTTSGAISVSLKFTVAGLAEGSLRPRYEWRDFGSATVRNFRDYGSPPTENQCIFIRGYFVPKRLPIFKCISDTLVLLGFHRGGGGKSCCEKHLGRQLIGSRDFESGGGTVMVAPTARRGVDWEATARREEREYLEKVRLPSDRMIR
ncbi:hypothetical protein FB451DRAFT_1063574 [Mycena latifolia]|nr:hypothetical protein FB451DRAFT_1063574 [Mycena latifolia]